MFAFQQPDCRSRNVRALPLEAQGMCFGRAASATVAVYR